MMTKLKRIFMVVVLCFVATLSVTGCEQQTWTKDELEQVAVKDYNKQLQEKGATYTCTSVNLIQEADNHWIGFAEFSDGSAKAEVEMTTDGENYMFKAVPMPG